MTDYLEPLNGHLSNKTYHQGDCKLFRSKTLSYSFHETPMGEGTGEIAEPVKELEGWIYPRPNTVGETSLRKVCTIVRNYREQ